MIVKLPANDTNLRQWMTEINYKEEGCRIIGACFELYNEKGSGFLEPVYQECLGIEFRACNMNALQNPAVKG